MYMYTTFDKKMVSEINYIPTPLFYNKTLEMILDQYMY